MDPTIYQKLAPADRQENSVAFRQVNKELADIKRALDEGVIVAITDKQGTITHVNEAFCRISKYSSDELIGQNHRIINSGYHPHAFFKEMWATIGYGRVWKGEVCNRAKDGSIYWVDTTIVPFLDDSGHPYQYVALRYDITERKRVEQELVDINRDLERRVEERTRQLQSANRELERRMRQHAVIAELGRFALSDQPLPELMTLVTRRIAEALEVEYGLVAKYLKDENKLIAEAGYGWQDWVVGQANILAVPEHQTGYTLLFNEPIIVEDFSTETRFKRSFLLTPHNILSGISVTIGDKGNPYGVLDAFATAPRVFSQDDVMFIQSAGNMLAMAIDRKNAEEAVRASQERYRHTAEALGEKSAQLEVINKELEAFSYSVSHDLRAPLRSIDGFSKLVIQTKVDQLDEEGRGFLERVCRSSQHMGLLIDDLLNLSRLSRAELRRQTTDLSRMAREVLDNLRLQHPERLVETHIEEGLTADADPILMRAVFDNLLGNAWKFTSHRTQAVIEFGRQQKEAVQNKALKEQAVGKTVFFIRDNGAGFDMAYADKLFGAFQRLHNMDEFPGTGIGLATVQRILHRHGGSIRAEAAVDQGATFYFSL